MVLSFLFFSRPFLNLRTFHLFELTQRLRPGPSGLACSSRVARTTGGAAKPSLSRAMLPAHSFVFVFPPSSAEYIQSFKIYLSRRPALLTCSSSSSFVSLKFIVKENAAQLTKKCPFDQFPQPTKKKQQGKLLHPSAFYINVISQTHTSI